MSRSFFPRFAFVLLISLGLVSGLRAALSDEVLATDWSFFKGDPAGAEQPTFSDSTWEKVTLPHTWTAMDENTRGFGWYRRTIDLPAQSPGQRYFLRFEAASLVADVYLNGKKLGQHRGGFTSFCYEITDVMKPGANQLAVRVDNTRFEDIAPLSGDFTIFGGLYRDVHLLKTDGLCINPLIDGAPGVAVSQSNVTPASAAIKVVTALSDKRATKTAPAAVQTTILDATGNPVAAQTTPIGMNASSITQQFALPKPHLWNGIADPYLYSVKVAVVSGGKVLDTVTQPLGLRTIAFSKTNGLTLNGRPYRMLGVCRHQDSAHGWAISKADQDADMALIREIGANAVRLAHYPHSDYFYELCDRNGILAWAEVPNVNEIRDTPAFTENARQQLRELIRQQGNHPSIFAWSLWNELGLNAEPTKLITQLKQDAHQLDPSRPTTAAADGRVRDKFPNVCPVTDILALNKYPGWYEGTPESMNGLLDGFQKFAARQPVGVSEYGAGANILQHEQNLTTRPAPNGQWHPEEWQNTVHEADWAAIAKRPFIWGSFLWNLFDFASAGRNEGNMRSINDKGLITRDRKIKKDAFYFYKASWSPEPVVYITSRRDAVRLVPNTPIKVYSNADNVQLKLNGVPLPGAQRTGVIYRWPSATLRPGDNIVEVSATRAGKAVTDRVVWKLDPTAKVPLPPAKKGATGHDAHVK